MFDGILRCLHRRSEVSAGIAFHFAEMVLSGLQGVEGGLNVRRVIGHLSDALMRKIDDCLKAALELP